ncbi:DUF2309 domain-containing protein [Aquincola tertiaricarbonis]|uniref:Probable inorganic carbon transporter subunit DabA n=1 Tax=Aquincola tertiaricarbonis TaxID=391953 RepID=A0ABY4S7X2_AQUTE|nr:DUF2309 domain-containing protein [Aquincola tertiaricarbonis]URI07191.1 DUF2309 domain-containing protein [Aquincola tertiaricarbonis]
MSLMLDPPTDTRDETLDHEVLRQAIRAACDRIAPTWPLDRFIAVNPWWGHRDRPIEEAAAQLAVQAGSPLLMPRAEFLRHWKAGTLGAPDLQAAIDAAGSHETVASLLGRCQADPPPPARLPLVTDLLDAGRDLRHAVAWRDAVTHHISQCCAAYFDDAQAAWGPDRSGGLYACWLRQSAHDLGPGMLMGFRGFSRRVAQLPREPQALIAQALQALRVPAQAQEAYLGALLLSINGWAAWCAYLRWQARLQQQDDDHLVQLLAVRLAWEWLLHQGHAAHDLASRLAAGWQRQAQAVAGARRAARADWLWQDALERSYQAPLCEALAHGGTQPETAPAVQAVFCIDVRSEVFRRALEAAGPQVHTRGFAGFFAMPVAWQALGTELQRPQLPGLLAPALCATEDSDEPGLGQWLARRRRQRLRWSQAWQAFKGSAGSGFSFVESCGLALAAPLLQRGLGRGGRAQPVEQAGLPADAAARLRPRWPAAPDGSDLPARVQAAAQALTAMGLKQGLARLVLLAGHGSSSQNNPHAAGLDCGACGGQTGEVNARLLAGLLNDPAVRQGLQAQGIALPATTWFVAGLHDTTTDECRLFDLDLLPASHAPDRAQLQAWLAEAGDRARAERAPGLGLGHLAGDAPALRQALQSRSQDWAQLRPEWGLAGCAAFIVAPRQRTRGLDLGGRAFLHDYDWRQDEGWRVLTLILTAPMVVTQWINAQYHASTVDPQRYGSGDKLLHNVVGGHLGVFEGNGGDLRIGLPLQSVHDGEGWRHVPLRLSVFVQAPAAAIESVITGHEVVRQLVHHGWLHLFRLGDDGGVWRYRVAEGGAAWVSEQAAAAA